MTPAISSRRHSKTPPPGETGQEALYLRSLSERQVPVAVKLRGGEVVRGWIEYFDDGMLRLTREGKPNLFIYKHQIETITEAGKATRTARRPSESGSERGRHVSEVGDWSGRLTEHQWTPQGRGDCARGRCAAARVLCAGRGDRVQGRRGPGDGGRSHRGEADSHPAGRGVSGAWHLRRRGYARALEQEFRWYVDPLDGTTNFAHGFPQFCVSLGLEQRWPWLKPDEDGTMVAAVIYDPMRDELFTAERGQGAKLNGKPLHVSQTADLAESLVATGFPSRKRHSSPNIHFYHEFTLRSHGVRRAGSAALDLAYVAAGRLEAFWEFNLNPWDTAAGILLVQEAGGRVTDFAGNPVRLDEPRGAGVEWPDSR